MPKSMHIYYAFWYKLTYRSVNQLMIRKQSVSYYTVKTSYQFDFQRFLSATYC